MANVCDECLTAVYDEMPGPMPDADEQAQLAIELGGDIGDHRCEQFDGGDRCDCACYGGPTVKHDQTVAISDDDELAAERGWPATI